MESLRHPKSTVNPGWNWIILGTLFLWKMTVADEIYKPHCRNALGMHSGAIPDEALTASSSYDSRNTGPQNARIRTDSRGGAWCPKAQIAHNTYEWLEVDLGEIKEVTLVEIQGRFGNGQGQEYAEHYMLEYQRTDENSWIRYRNKNDEELFTGNVNTYIAELREVNPPIIARRIRFVPYSRHQRTICLRVELFGCDWKEGIVSYSMPQGHVRGSELVLFDFAYDGEEKNGFLSGGLGQLVDGDEGFHNFRLDNQNIGKKGYEWVGWRNDSSTEPVSMIFEFDTIRNFSSVQVFCNNMYSKSVRQFSMAKLYFSLDGETFRDRVSLPVLKDSLMEYARPIVVPIPHRIAQYVKVDLYYEDRWIMISEVSFKSEKVNITVLDNILPVTTTESTSTTEKVTTTPKNVVRPRKPKPTVPKIEEPYLVDVDPVLKEQLVDAPYQTEPLA